MILSTVNRNSRIALFQGGTSSEREISCQSGMYLQEGIEALGHKVITIDPAEQDWKKQHWESFDLAVIALHGEFGEDGQLQSFLDEMGLVYCGSNAEASRTAFSKLETKTSLNQAGIPTPSAVPVHAGDHAEEIERLTKMIGFPLFVKPDRQGSSIGVSLVHTPEELPQALGYCFAHGETGLLEQAIIGTEYSLGLMGKEPLPLVQIETEHPFYDYSAKYGAGCTRYHFDLALNQHVLERIHHLGKQVVCSLGTQGIVRMDFMLDRFQQPWILEVNTIPGFTKNSLIPLAIAKMQLSLPKLMEWMLQDALNKSAAESVPNAISA